MAMLHTVENLSKKNKRDVKGSATASSGAATCNTECGTITSESITTANGSDYTLTLTCGTIKTTDVIGFFHVRNGSATTGGPYIPHDATFTVGQCVVKFRNASGSAAANGTIKIDYLFI